MTTRRRLNIPLSVLLALGVACGLGSVGGLAVGADAPGSEGSPSAALDELVAGRDLAADEGCVQSAVPLPRLRHRGACESHGPAARARLPHRR
jgi:hypothetical protein